jgi:hypothetical protein
MPNLSRMTLIPAGYMAKRVLTKPDWLKNPHVIEIASVSHCNSKDFADYINYWQHNGYWFFDSPEIIRDLISNNGIDSFGLSYFYYEVYHKQYDDELRVWVDFKPEDSFTTNVQHSSSKTLLGFDIVTFHAQTSPECSPLSCNQLAETITVNQHCLLDSLEEAVQLIETGAINNSETGPYRIFAVYQVETLQL